MAAGFLKSPVHEGGHRRRMRGAWRGNEPTAALWSGDRWIADPRGTQRTGRVQAGKGGIDPLRVIPTASGAAIGPYAASPVAAPEPQHATFQPAPPF